MNSKARSVRKSVAKSSHRHHPIQEGSPLRFSAPTSGRPSWRTNFPMPPIEHEATVLKTGPGWSPCGFPSPSMPFTDVAGSVTLFEEWTPRCWFRLEAAHYFAPLDCVEDRGLSARRRERRTHRSRGVKAGAKGPQRQVDQYGVSARSARHNTGSESDAHRFE